MMSRIPLISTPQNSVITRSTLFSNVLQYQQTSASNCKYGVLYALRGYLARNF